MTKENNVKLKEKNMTIMECIDKLDKKELEKLYKHSQVGHSKRKLSIEEKKKSIYTEVLAKFMLLSMILSDEEIKQLDDLINGKEINHISENLQNYNFIFKIDNEFIIPKEIKEAYSIFQKEETQNSRKNIAISTYLKMNGVLEIDKLVELLNISGINIAKKDITKIAKENDFIIKKNKIYFDEIAVTLDKHIDLITFKNDKVYKEVSLLEMLQMSIKDEAHNYLEKLSNILSKVIKKKDKLSFCTGKIYLMICLGGNYEENIDNLIQNNNIKLTKKVEKDLYDLIEKIYINTPSWELNGYYPYELYDEYEPDESYSEKDIANVLGFTEDDLDFEDFLEDNYMDDEFDVLSEEEQKMLAIHTYLTINGVMRVEKLLDIIKNHHNLNITKKEIKNLANSGDDLKLTKDIIYIDGFEEEIPEILKIKDQINDYKIIENIDEFWDEYDYQIEKIEEICSHYNIYEEDAETIKSAIMVGFFNEEMLSTILEELDIKLPLKKQNQLSKELKPIIKNTRTWMLNGYTPLELSKPNKKEKIGRNEKCPCGSGRKYKQCCGK